MTVALWSVLLEAPPDIVRRLYATLSPDERDRARRYATELLATRFIIRRGALRTLLAARMGCLPSSLFFDYSRAGKPFVCGRPIAFNMSHSDRLAVIAISDCRLVLGIDVEAVRVVPDLHTIARRFFGSGERDELALVEEPRQTEAFLSVWTRKEAYLKAVGDGLFAPLDQFEVNLRPGEQPAFRHINGDAAAAETWRIHHFSLPGYIVALVYRGDATVAPWQELDLTGTVDRSSAR
jgi:4'-phosphopantetheinyl transferase